MLKVAAILSFLIWGILFVILQAAIGKRAGGHNKSKRHAPLPARQYLTIATSIFSSLGLFSLAGEWFVEPDRFLAVRIAGWVTVLAGLALSGWAQHCLGRNWVGGVGTVKQHQLVTHGPYRFVRHPLYSGVMVSAVGIVLVSIDPFYGLAALLFAASLIVQYPAEERLLLARFHTKHLREYQEYLQSTPVLIPRFRRPKA